MFTGIIEEIGIIKSIHKGANFATVEISAKTALSNTKIGDSVAVDGVCLTVTKINNQSFTADVMPETFKRSSFEKIITGSKVNIERALSINGRLGGHIVSGHIDGIGKIIEKKINANSVVYTILTQQNISKYIVEKGSIAIDGTSLTVVSVSKNQFEVAIIPQTKNETTLGEKNIGEIVNLECDMIVKYVEKLIGNNKNEKNLIKILEENGF